MKHYLILKLRESEAVPQVAAKARSVLGHLPEELDGVRSVLAVRNCVPREENHDLMIEMDFRDEEVLQEYLKHPRHKEFIAFAAPLVASKVTFDCL